MDIKRYFGWFLNLPLRAKITLSFLVVICFGGIVSLFFGTRLEHQTIISLAQVKVKHDLSSAWMVYDEKLSDIKDIVRQNSTHESIQKALLAGDTYILARYLGRVQKEFNLDFLTLTDGKGRVIVRTSQSESVGDDQSQDQLVSRSLKGEIVTGTQILPREELLKEGKSLADRAYIKFIPTLKAAFRPEDHEEKGMILKGAAPVVDDKGDVIGVLYGGVLLNQNYEIVDRVKEIVYKGEKYKGKEIGTVTIFQGDLRISTNVKDASGKRAIGTLVSQEVDRAVLQEGKSWIGRAFVVNDYYLTAYEPIKNIEGKIIGILYVGMLEKPYIDLRNRVMLTFTGMAILATIVLLVILFFITSSIINPIRGMVLATNKIAQGDLNSQVDIDYRDEIGQLAHSFNQMTENLKRANQKLIEWAKTLEKRVDARTQELKEMQDFLIQSEKMASLGKMAAGVAHEINNPLTSILINTHLMLEKLEKKHPFYESLGLIADETSRCTQIVKSLLEFSRQEPPQKVKTDINETIERAIHLLENKASFQNIRINKELNPSLPQIAIDKNKIQQVLWNLMLNSSEAMPEGGNLTIISQLSKDQKYIEIIFIDTGIGIPKENLNRLFDPFFTTKSTGTGLGLAVSYGIIQQHQGLIEVKSEVGQGSVFTLSLPLTDQTKNKKNEEVLNE
jgi:two-component system NtrC family sensor kinase